MKKRTNCPAVSCNSVGRASPPAAETPSDASVSSDGSSSQSVSSAQEESTSVEDRSAGGDVSVDRPRGQLGRRQQFQRPGRGCLHPGPGGHLRQYNHPDPAVLRTACGDQALGPAASDPHGDRAGARVEPDPEPASEPATDPEPEPRARGRHGGRRPGLHRPERLQPHRRHRLPHQQLLRTQLPGPGEDGELIYNGFTVYTYRENGMETVEDVL